MRAGAVADALAFAFSRRDPPLHPLRETLSGTEFWRATRRCRAVEGENRFEVLETLQIEPDQFARSLPFGLNLLEQSPGLLTLVALERLDRTTKLCDPARN